MPTMAQVTRRRIVFIFIILLVVFLLEVLKRGRRTDVVTKGIIYGRVRLRGRHI